MSAIKDKIQKRAESIKSRIQERAEEMTNKAEISAIRARLEDGFENNPEFAGVYEGNPYKNLPAKGYLYWRLYENDEVVGYKVVDCEVTLNKETGNCIYTPVKEVHTKNGKDVFTLDELAEFDHQRPDGGAVVYWGKGLHDEMVKENKFPAFMQLVKQHFGGRKG